MGMTVRTDPCRVCGADALVEPVDFEGWVMWDEGYATIDEALPDLDEDQRRLLETGIHAHCWFRWEGWRHEWLSRE